MELTFQWGKQTINKYILRGLEVSSKRKPRAGKEDGK